MKTALIAGASGLVGGHLLSLLLESEQYEKIISIGRRNLNIEQNKLTQRIVDFNNLDLEDQNVDDIFCCLGTTMKKAGSKEKFRLVDFQYPINIASYFLSKGAKRFLLVSAMGAKASSSVFYNSVKGEVEIAINKLGYYRTDVFRPSLLLGNRSESRFAEVIGKVVMTTFGLLLVGSLKNYKAINSVKVAKAMLYFAQEESNGDYIHLSADLQKFK
jgi:uncharacterized protein YbjT (DUF2867 family)